MMGSNLSKTFRFEIIYLILSALFSVTLLMSGFLSVEFFSFPWISCLTIPAGLIIYPLVIVIGYLTAEIYGARKARLIVYVGICVCAVSLGFLHLVDFLPDTLHTFKKFFSLANISMMSSLAAQFVSSHLDIRLFAFTKEMTK